MAGLFASQSPTGNDNSISNLSIHNKLDSFNEYSPIRIYDVFSYSNGP